MPAADTGGSPIVATSITGFDPNHYYPPTSTQFSIGVEQALGAKAVLSVSYVGNQNRHQNFYQEINAPDDRQVPCPAQSWLLNECDALQPGSAVSGVPLHPVGYG